MTVGKLWAGRLYGTNTGNVFVELDGPDDNLSGVVRLNDTEFGLVVYEVAGAFDGTALTLAGRRTGDPIEGVAYGDLMAVATLNPRGEFSGQWKTTIGSGGTFRLHPHSATEVVGPAEPEDTAQLHTARCTFGAVSLDRAEIVELAEQLQADFAQGKVVVTVVAGTEQSKFLPDFKQTRFQAKIASILKVQVQEPETNGINRVAMIEFGPHLNTAMTQGADESWVLGMREKIKQRVQPFERTYTTNFRRLGFGINQVLLVGALVYLPSLPSLWNRIVLMLGILVLMLSVSRFHSRFLPFAALRLDDRPQSAFAKMAPSALSWVIAFSSALAATLLGAFLQGSFDIGQ